MPRRLLDKKIIEISFPHSSIKSEGYFYNSVKVDSLSSDEEQLFDNKNEILWSRKKSGCFSEEDFFKSSHNDFSDASWRTVSSCSWHNDEFDMKSTSQVKASLEAIDSALYEQHRGTTMDDDLFRECSEWSCHFPYLRLQGEQLGNTCAAAAHSSGSASGLLVEGRQVGRRRPVSELHRQDSEDSECCDNEASEFDVPLFTRDMHEQIIEKLAVLLWPKVLTTLQVIKEKNLGAEEGLHLPPLGQTEGKKSIDFPRLTDLLTVSPKVLQQRPGSGAIRPASETTRCSTASRSPSTLARCGRNNDPILLPALQEDRVESSNVLQRIHFELETNQLPLKELASDRFIGRSGISLKSDSFLPPIEDRSYISSHSTFGQSLLSLCGGPPRTASCRTSSRRSYTNNINLQQKYVTGSEQLSAKKSASQEKEAVTLFPIVTALLPQQERSFAHVKKEGFPATIPNRGLFGTFVGKKR